MAYASFARPRRRQSTFGTPQANPYDQSTQGFNFNHPLAQQEGARLAAAMRPLPQSFARPPMQQPVGFSPMNGNGAVMQNLPYRFGTGNGTMQNLPYRGGGNPQVSLFGGQFALPMMAANALAGATMGGGPQVPSLAQQRAEIGAMADEAWNRAQANQFGVLQERSRMPTAYMPDASANLPGGQVPSPYPFTPQERKQFAQNWNQNLAAGSGPYDQTSTSSRRFGALAGQQPAYEGPATVAPGTTYSGGSTVATMPSGNQGLMPPDALVSSQNAQRALEASRRGLAFAPGATVGHRAPQGMVNVPGFPLPMTPEQRTNIINNSPRMQQARAFGQAGTTNIGGIENTKPEVAAALNAATDPESGAVNHMAFAQNVFRNPQYRNNPQAAGAQILSVMTPDEIGSLLSDARGIAGFGAENGDFVKWLNEAAIGQGVGEKTGGLNEALTNAVVGAANPIAGVLSPIANIVRQSRARRDQTEIERRRQQGQKKPAFGTTPAPARVPAFNRPAAGFQFGY